MKYPSLVQTTLVVVDGRKRTRRSKVAILGALLALQDGYDCHILVLVESEDQAQIIEKLGEDCGQDMYFHSEAAVSKEEFLRRCLWSKCVVFQKVLRVTRMTSPWV